MAAFFFFSVGLLISNAAMAEHYMVVGGGYDPYGSQAVLEKNVELFRTVAEGFGVSTESQTTLFGGGSRATILDILEKSPEFTFKERLFSTMFDACKSPDCFLRHNRLSRLDGPSRQEDVQDWLAGLAETRGGKTSLRFYYTGHGSPDRLNLWHGKLTAQEFTTLLDGFQAETPIQVVMVQCFSGSFAQMNYVTGDSSKPLSSANRCGFFSQLPDRLAAGCSPDLTKREEYSPYFWAAYAGKTEKGQPVDADYNKDGKITSDEAHAFVIQEEGSIDVPITTSSAFLRQKKYEVSRLGRLLTVRQIREALAPAELAVWKNLVKKTRFRAADGDSALRAIDREVDFLSDAHTQKEKEVDAARAVMTGFLERLRSDLRDEFAIFRNTYGANFGRERILGESELAKARRALERHELYRDYSTALQNVMKGDDVADELERRKVKFERLQYLVETKLRETDLALRGVAADKARYEQLKQCEARPFFN